VTSEDMLCDDRATTPTGRLDEWVHEAGVIQADAYYGRRAEVLDLGPAIRTDEVMH
jgi:hypothetical protein